MSENIIRAEAEKVLLAAFRTRCSKKDYISSNIVAVLRGNHKTYKYILVNGLLAKATNENINPLALQAGASIEGAYDARSLCHNVLVPFERDFLQNALGGSNEPFLNKPARFTHLSDRNAVRRGRDKETLELVIKIFESIPTSIEANHYLTCALEFLAQKIEENKILHDSKINYNPTLVEIYEFIFRFLEKPYEGETLAIVVAAIEKIYYQKLTQNYKVVAHKVNQSGASSKEVGDIDVYKDDNFYYAIEVKDKNFTSYDLEHAFKKIQDAGGMKGQFIFGPNAAFDKDSVEKRVSAFAKENFMALLQDVYTYARIMIFKIDFSNKQEFIDSIIETAIEINSKDECKTWVQTLLVELNWK
ncbi:restriction endonuclease, SacI family [Haliscomenobacter hydrossis]|uniref:Restriction endonuclease, type II, SacI n=1 Tax=Haliscomenobacter hydrossis (strain ATCC 27775 / DSM 1100 / LMG 10767 / O) TaxID=760192 RepID=F4KPK0_HALH1|nr:restriction endonuclease, SacI family [Haliscomenobacter hydrossis]AEE50938.1 Restriction endonuclease, type II, SacI [Haliscomenobacter hydrossis DSM 1100]